MATLGFFFWWSLELVRIYWKDWRGVVVFFPNSEPFLKASQSTADAFRQAMLVDSNPFVMGTPISTKRRWWQEKAFTWISLFQTSKLMQNEYTQVFDPGNWRYKTYKWSHNPTCNGRCIATKPSISSLFLPGDSCHRSFGTCLPTWSSTIALALGCFGCLALDETAGVSGVEMLKRTGFAPFGWWFQRFLFLPLLGEMMRFD